MRTTKRQITTEERDILDYMADPMIQASEDITLTKSFVYDVYALFAADSTGKYQEFKTYWELFSDVRALYVALKVSGLRKTIMFYTNIKNYLHGFIGSRLFRKLDKEEPMEATRIFLEMFKPKDTPPMPSQQEVQDKMDQQQGGGEQQDGQGQQGDQQEDHDGGGSSSGDQQQNQEQEDEQEASGGGAGEEDENDEEKEGQESQQGGQSEQQEEPDPNVNIEDEEVKEEEKKENDQSGTSADAKNLPVDMEDIADTTEEIEDMIEAGVFDDHDLSEVVANNAGLDHREIKIGNAKKIIDKLGDKLDKELAIYKVARKHEFVDVYRKSFELDDSLTPDDNMDIETNKSINDVVRALPSEYLYDDDLFTKKVLENSLNVTQYKTQRLKKQVLYLLLDVSASMQGYPSLYATGIALSLVKQALREDATYFLRYFDYQPSQLRSARNREEAKNLVEELMRHPFSGGGTSFDNAISTAIRDIKKDKAGFEEADIMIITDGEDNTSITMEDLDFIKLHTVIVGAYANDKHHPLRKISQSYVGVTNKEITDTTGNVKGVSSYW